MSTGASLARDVLEELDVVAGADVADAQDTAYALKKINLTLDDWSVPIDMAYVRSVTSYPITPSLQPHTLGPTGTIVVAQRPVSIEAINVLSGSTRTPLEPLTVDDWMALVDATTTETAPAAYYYAQTFPNGSLWFFPIPTGVGPIEIQTRGLLAQLTLASVAVLPPGYQSALVLTAAEACATHFHAIPPQAAAAKARARIMKANTTTPRLVSDAPGVSRGKSNIFTGAGSSEWIS